jgi:DNA recombination protein RmuC
MTSLLISLTVFLALLAAFIYKVWEVSLLRKENIALLVLCEHMKAKESALSFNQEAIKETFKALSHDALKNNSENFFEMAERRIERQKEGMESEIKLKKQAIENLIKPLSISLEKVNENISILEKNRTIAFSTLHEQIKTLTETHNLLKGETANLVKALRTPHVRGRWGEIQLKRVVEIAGMVEHCDFVQQKTADDGFLRPDMIIHLPENKKVIVDAKTPLIAYLEAIEEPEEAKALLKFKEHAKQLKSHMLQLSQKAYWNQFDETPEFVVLFLPGEPIFSAALQQDPELIEWGAQRHVIIATPTTLIALLKSVAYGWRQESLAENARQIASAGKDLYDRLVIFSSHFADVRKGLEKAVLSFNQSVASFETRLIPGAKKLTELGIKANKDLTHIELVEVDLKSLIEK